MPAYVVSVRPSSGVTLHDVRKVVVNAGSQSDARAAAIAYQASDPLSAVWDVADVQEVTADTDLENWVFNVSLTAPGGRLPVVSVSVTGAAGNAPDDIGAALVTALNGTNLIANAAYDTATNVLTVAGTADSLGDHVLGVEAVPPWGEASYDPFYSSVVDGGAEGDAVTVTLLGDGATIPEVHDASRD